MKDINADVICCLFSKFGQYCFSYNLYNNLQYSIKYYNNLLNSYYGTLRLKRKSCENYLQKYGANIIVKISFWKDIMGFWKGLDIISTLPNYSTSKWKNFKIWLKKQIRQIGNSKKCCKQYIPVVSGTLQHYFIVIWRTCIFRVILKGNVKQTNT